MLKNNFNQNTVTIYVWKNSEFFGATGHVALRTYQHGRNNQGIYVSFWPNGRNDADYMHEAFLVEYHDGGCFRTHKYDLLKVNGGQPPDYALHLSDLNTKKIALEFEKILAERIIFSLYSSMAILDFFSKTANCSQIIYRLLRAAGLPHEFVRMGYFLSGLALCSIAAPALAVSGIALLSLPFGYSQAQETLKVCRGVFLAASVRGSGSIMGEVLSDIQGNLISSPYKLILAPLITYAGFKLCQRSGYKSAALMPFLGTLSSVCFLAPVMYGADRHKYSQIYEVDELIPRGGSVEDEELREMLLEPDWIKGEEMVVHVNNTMFWYTSLLMGISIVERVFFNSPNKTLSLISLYNGVLRESYAQSPMVEEVQHSKFSWLLSKLSLTGQYVWREHKLTCITLALTIYKYRGYFYSMSEIMDLKEFMLVEFPKILAKIDFSK